MTLAGWDFGYMIARTWSKPNHAYESAPLAIPWLRPTKLSDLHDPRNCSLEPIVQIDELPASVRSSRRTYFQWEPRTRDSTLCFGDMLPRRTMPTFDREAALATRRKGGRAKESRANS